MGQWLHSPLNINRWVLLVEDDEALRVLLALDLEDRGFAVRDVADAETALGILDANLDQFAVLVTDLDLGPGLPNGRALASEALVRRPDLVVIFVSGSPRWFGRRERGERILAKPFTLDALEAAVHEAAAASGISIRQATPPSRKMS
jgi:DNA-binding response OmpR family regulator